MSWTTGRHRLQVGLGEPLAEALLQQAQLPVDLAERSPDLVDDDIDHVSQPCRHQESGVHVLDALDPLSEPLLRLGNLLRHRVVPAQLLLREVERATDVEDLEDRVNEGVGVLPRAELVALALQKREHLLEPRLQRSMLGVEDHALARAPVPELGVRLARDLDGRDHLVVGEVHRRVLAAPVVEPEPVVPLLAVGVDAEPVAVEAHAGVVVEHLPDVGDRLVVALGDGLERVPVAVPHPDLDLERSAKRALALLPQLLRLELADGLALVLEHAREAALPVETPFQGVDRSEHDPRRLDGTRQLGVGRHVELDLEVLHVLERRDQPGQAGVQGLVVVAVPRLPQRLQRQPRPVAQVPDGADLVVDRDGVEVAVLVERSPVHERRGALGLAPGHGLHEQKPGEASGSEPADPLGPLVDPPSVRALAHPLGDGPRLEPGAQHRVERHPVPVVLDHDALRGVWGRLPRTGWSPGQRRRRKRS